MMLRSIACFLAALTTVVVKAASDCSLTWKCMPTTNGSVKVDADLSDWSKVNGIVTDLLNITGATYTDGQASYKCVYDGTRVYLALEIPGEYRFDETDANKCAAIATMMKIGTSATFIDMGGCPDAADGCVDGVPDTCGAYLVDIGAHWELADTQQSTLYPVNGVAEANQTGTGDDVTPANKDDEYGVSPFCRFDDDDDDADNEWHGAWTHTNPMDGESGTYIFELSRSLTTKSSTTDAQMKSGETYQFGIAFWNPNEMAAGWSDMGHYVTGCGADWIDLELVAGSDTGGTSEASSLKKGFFSATSIFAMVLWW